MLQGLIGTIFKFCEGKIALTADMESIFLQAQFPQLDRCCLRLLLVPRINEPVHIYESQRQNFVAQSSLNCANYASKREGVKKRIQLQQRQSKTTSTLTISSNQNKALKKQLKYSII